MNKKLQGSLLLLSLIIYYIFHDILSVFIPSNLRMVSLGLWFILFGLFIFWLYRNTDFFKKIPLKERAEHRLKVAEELGLISIVIYVGYILGFILIGIGIFELFLPTDEAQKFDIFWIMTVFGLIVILIMFFTDRRRKKNLPLSFK